MVRYRIFDVVTGRPSPEQLERLRRVQRHVRELTRSVSFSADVEEGESTPNLLSVHVRPHKTGAAPISLSFSSEDIVLNAGRAARVELGTHDDDLLLLALVWHAVRRGNLEERVDHRGSRYQVHLADGSTRAGGTGRRPAPDAQTLIYEGY